MRYRTGLAFRTALKAHIAQRARQSSMSIQWLRKAVTFERLLARLVVAAPDRWALKGALALDFRLGAATRATKDMDLVRQDDTAAASEDLHTAGALDLDDYFAFTITQTDQLDALQEGTAVRYHLTAALAGRPFEAAVIDVGFDSALNWRPACPG